MEREVHVFVVWPRALPLRDRIVADLRTRFRVLDALTLEWDPDHFERSVLRFYGTPALDDGRKRSSRGHPVVIIVEDDQPRYSERRRSSGPVLVNERTFDAKHRYRAWTGGGHGVHASTDRAEAERDLFFLLGVRPGTYASDGEWDGGFRILRRDLVGSREWNDPEELFTAMAVSMPFVLLGQHGQGARVLTENLAWALLFANANHPVREPEGVAVEVSVSGRPYRLVLQEPGDGVLDPAWQRRLIEEALPLPRPATASAREQLLIRVHLEMAYRPASFRFPRDELDRLAHAAGLTPVDWTDRAAAWFFLDTELGRDGHSFTSTGSSAQWDARLLPGGVPPRPPRRGPALVRGLAFPVRRLRSLLVRLRRWR